jgi:hypothetical protein
VLGGRLGRNRPGRCGRYGRADPVSHHEKAGAAKKAAPAKKTAAKKTTKK